jgi:hypothetical protein
LHVVDTTGSPLRLHQSFVRFTHVETAEVCIFVALYAPKDGLHSLMLDLADSLNFQYLSGLYNIQLLLGDAAIEVWRRG